MRTTCWRALLACLMAAALVSLARADTPRPGAFLRFPDIHGEMVVFTCEGDL